MIQASRHVTTMNLLTGYSRLEGEKLAREMLARRKNHTAEIERPVHAACAPSSETEQSPRCSVFLSHTGQDDIGRIFAGMMSDGLKQQNIEYFYDTQSLQAGRQWDIEIENNVKGCNIFVCIFSASFCLRYYCMRELDLAFATGRQILPVYVEGSLPPKESDCFKKIRDSMRKSRHTVDKPTLRRWVANLDRLRSIQGFFIESSSKDREVRLKNTVVDWIKNELSRKDFSQPYPQYRPPNKGQHH